MSEPTKDSVEYIVNKFAENPGHFAATILRMYWDMEKQCDQFKSERDILTDDLSRYKAKVSKLERDNEQYIKLLKEFNNLINYKLDIHPGSDVYMYYRSELNKLGVK